MAESNRNIFVLFLIVFLDLLGIGIVIPLLAPLFIGPLNPFALSAKDAPIILGLLLASYPLAQFFGAPIIGAWSDHVGRKKAFLVSLAGTFLGYVLFAYGIITSNLALLFLSRIIDGFTGGNISVAYSAIADMSTKENKIKNFGLIGMAFGFGFVIGPFIGGKLADPTVLPWFDFSTPFIFAAILSIVNIIFVQKIFSETIAKRVKTKLSFATGIQNLVKAFSMPNLRVIFTVIFFLAVGFSFFTQFFQVYLVDKFAYTQGQIGDLFAFVGIWIAITQGIFVRYIAKRFSSVNALGVSSVLLGLTLPLLIIPTDATLIYFIIPFIAIFNGITMPNYTAIVSNLAGKESQGEIMGINQSIQSMAIALPAIIAGFLAVFDIAFPIIAASLITLAAAVLFNTLFRAQNKELFHEV